MSPVVLIFAIIIIAIPLFLYSCYVTIKAIKQSNSSIAIMLLGLQISLIGGVLVLDVNLNLSGIEYIILFIGLLISVVGLQRTGIDKRTANKTE